MDRRVARTLEIMRHDFHRDFRLEELAAAVGLSPSRLALLFRQQVGEPPKRYLARMRTEEAWAFLDELLPPPRTRSDPPARQPETDRQTRRLIRKHAVRFTGRDGVLYATSSYGRQRRDGTWIGWIEFRPSQRWAAVLRTGRETTQPDRRALEYWADGLEPLYFEGAFERAL